MSQLKYDGDFAFSIFYYKRAFAKNVVTTDPFKFYIATKYFDFLRKLMRRKWHFVILN